MHAQTADRGVLVGLQDALRSSALNAEASYLSERVVADAPLGTTQGLTIPAAMLIRDNARISCLVPLSSRKQ